MERNKLAAAVVAGSVVVGLLGWVAGRQIRSPAQVAAETAPPTASLITAPVEKRALAAEVVVRGTVRHTAPVAVTLATSSLKPTGAVVTTPPVKGAQIAEGTAALAVAGRPVLVLQGAVPAYRDLAIGVSGPDVRQLQEALRRLGFDAGRADGTFDAGTARAVGAWYKSAGWTPFAPTEAQRQTLRSARDAAAQALDKRLQAELALQKEAKGSTPADLFQAQSDVVGAQDGVAAAQAAVASAQAKQSAARGALARAATPVERAQAQLDLDTAAAELARASASVGPAQAKLDFANARLAQLQQPPDLGVQRRILSASAADASRSASDLTLIERETAFQVPADELLFFPSLPLQVDDTKAKRGDVVAADIMTVSGLRLSAEGALSINDAKLVTPGAKVTLEEPDLRITVPGVVLTIADRPGTNGVDPQKVYLEVAPDNAPAQLVGASVKLTIAVRSTQGEVLAVPISAVTVGAAGRSRLQVVDRDGSTRYVDVTPGLAAQGLVEITPTGGRLAVGDQVVVGRSKSARPTVPPAPASGSTPSTTTGTTTPTGSKASGR